MIKKILAWVIMALIVVAFITLGAAGGIGAIVIGLPIIGLLLKEKKKVSQMSGLEYENWCAAQLVKKKGFRSATVTPASGDYGADIIAVDKQGQRWVIQCKKYSKNVDNTAVQEAVAAKAHYKADRAAVMTNKELTKKARELAWENAVELFEGFSD